MRAALPKTAAGAAVATLIAALVGGVLAGVLYLFTPWWPGEGPLDARVLTSGPINSPRQDQPWTGTNAWFLCTQGADVELESVRVLTSGSARDVGAGVQIISPGDTGGQQIINAQGTPPDFPEPYARPWREAGLLGRYVEVAGAAVTLPCDDSDEAYDEAAVPGLLIHATVGAERGSVGPIEVTYRAGLRTWTTTLPQRIELCGYEEPRRRC